MSKKNKNKGTNKNKGSDVVVLILLCVALIFAILAIKELYPILDAKSQNSEIKRTMIEESKDPMDRKINFTSLKEKNSDIVGWVYIPDTSVDYPILIGDTDDEYLRRDVYGNYSVPGSIFALANTNKDLSDARVSLFGHNMMYYEKFGELKRYYKEEDFRKDHSDFYVYTENKTMKCKIFSIFDCHETDSLISNYKSFEPGYSDLLRELYSKNDYDDLYSNINSIEEYSDSQVFTMITCKGQVGTDIRLLVNGIVVEEKIIE